MKQQQIHLFDTTLRDGQQCPGAGMSFEKNIEYAHLVGQAGIDVLEAGFASASPLDFKIVQTIASELPAAGYPTVIASLCQLREAQIDRTIEALLPAQAKGKARLHTYLPVDPELMQASLGKYAQDKKQLVNQVHDFIKRAVDAGLDVEFSPEGYSRQGKNFEFTTDVIRAAIQAGAQVINCPDTIGGGCYLQGDTYFVKTMQQHADMMKKEFPQRRVCWSTHCHNDFGLAVANSLHAVFEGPATQIEGCFNGIGERAGNAALEQCIMILREFGKQKEIEYYTQFKPAYLKAISDFVSTHMLPCQPHWPVTGENAACHTSGGHTNAILNNPLAYQPFDPKDVGADISFVFGPMSGGNHAQAVIHKYGYVCEDHEKAAIAQYIKEVYAERRKGITDAELIDAYLHYRKPIKVERFDYTRQGEHTCLVLIGDFFTHSNQFEVTHQGDDSALAALHQAICPFMTGVEIETYHSEGIGKGIDAVSRSTIVISNENKKMYTGVGEHHDIHIAALHALVDAVNQAYIAEYFVAQEDK